VHVVRTGLGRQGLTRPRRTLGAAASLALALLAVPGAGVASANTLAAPTVSPSNPRATEPATIGISGTASTPSVLRVFVQPSPASGCAGGGSGAANADAQAQRVGSVEVITRAPTAAFAYSATYTPPAAGNYALCAYLYGATAATGASQVSTNFSVAPAPPIAPPSVVGTPQPPAAMKPPVRIPAHCVVPNLKGRTYLGARTRLRRAGCSTGTVYRPTRTAPKGMVLRVTWQLQTPGSVRKLNSRVTLRLSFVKRPRS
jgi:hypothetical protein